MVAFKHSKRKKKKKKASKEIDSSPKHTVSPKDLLPSAAPQCSSVSFDSTASKLQIGNTCTSSVYVGGPNTVTSFKGKVMLTSVNRKDSWAQYRCPNGGSFSIGSGGSSGSGNAVRGIVMNGVPFGIYFNNIPQVIFYPNGTTAIFGELTADNVKLSSKDVDSIVNYMEGVTFKVANHQQQRLRCAYPYMYRDNTVRTMDTMFVLEHIRYPGIDGTPPPYF
jgi:hypothetical protein